MSLVPASYACVSFAERVSAVDDEYESSGVVVIWLEYTIACMWVSVNVRVIAVLVRKAECVYLYEG